MVKKKKKDINIGADSLRNVKDSKIVIDLSSETAWTCVTCKTVSFTNKLKSSSHFLKMHKSLFEEVIPFLQNNTVANINKLNHCHIEIDKLDKISKIFRAILETKYKNNGDSFINNKFDSLFVQHDIYQLGLNNSIRLYGYFDGFIFKVLFIDYHHLIWDSVKHNQHDFMQYTFEPHGDSVNE